MTMSMRALFGWVAFAAIGAASLTQASVLWTTLIFTAAVLFTGWAILAAILLRDSRRTFWIGAAACSLGYFFLISGGLAAISGRTGNAEKLLITHQLLACFAPQDPGGGLSPYGSDTMWSGQLLMDTTQATVWAPAYPTTVPIYSAPTLPSNTVPASSYKPNTDTADESSSPAEEDESSSPTQFPTPQLPGNLTPYLAPPIGFGSPPPAAFRTGTPISIGRGSRFLVTGHCLFVILFGLVGGWGARRFLGPATVAVA